MYTITDRGEPIADIAPHRVGPWRPAVEVEGVSKKLGVNQAWFDDQRGLRDEAELSDPFTRVP